MVFRAAIEADIPKILEFIRALAVYEKMEHEVVATEALLRGQIVFAFAAHPFAPLGVLTVLYYEVTLFLAARGKGRPSAAPAVAFAIGLVGFFLLRNLLLVFGGVDLLGDLASFWQ